MVLGVGWNGYQCDYLSGCDWVVDGIDYSDYFYDSWQDCEENCQCEDGEIDNENPCNPRECWDGQWIEIVIDWNTEVDDGTLPSGIKGVSFWYKHVESKNNSNHPYIFSHRGRIKNDSGENLGAMYSHLRLFNTYFQFDSEDGIITEWYADGKLITQGQKSSGGYDDGMYQPNNTSEYYLNNWTHHFLKFKSDIKVEWLSWFVPNWQGENNDREEEESQYYDNGYISDVRFFNSSSLSFTETDITNIKNNNITSSILNAQLKHETFKNQQEITLQNTSGTFVKNNSYKIKLEIKNNKFDFYVDGTKILP